MNYPEHLDAIGALRARVWLEKGKLPVALVKNGVWLDGYDKNALHWVVRVDGVLAGAARLHIADHPSHLPYANEWHSVREQIASPVALMMRLVVDSRFRGMGIARVLDEVRLARASLAGARSLIINAAPERAHALQLLNFKEIGRVPEGFTQSDIIDEGVLMLRNLGQS